MIGASKYINHFLGWGKMSDIVNYKETKKRLNDEIYTDICTVLTDYESNDEDVITAMSASEWMEQFYNLLVKIQNNWEELTGEQG